MKKIISTLLLVAATITTNAQTTILDYQYRRAAYTKLKENKFVFRPRPCETRRATLERSLKSVELMIDGRLHEIGNTFTGRYFDGKRTTKATVFVKLPNAIFVNVDGIVYQFQEFEYLFTNLILVAQEAYAIPSARLELDLTNSVMYVYVPEHDFDYLLSPASKDFINQNFDFVGYFKNAKREKASYRYLK